MERKRKLLIVVGVCVVLANPVVSVSGLVQADESTNGQVEQVRQVSSNTFTNGNVTVAVNGSGAFRMQANGTPILYPGYTSYLTIQVDDTNYSRASSSSLTQFMSQRPTLVGDTIVTEWRLPNGVVARQNVTFEGDDANFTVEIVNRGTSSHDVRVRYLFDYQVREQDGAPLRIEDRVYTNETSFSSPTFDSWEALPIIDNRNTANFSLVGRQQIVTRPDQVMFANWTWANYFPYEYSDFDENRRFYTPGYVTSPQSDSSGLLYWNLGSLSTGDSQTVTTKYGASKPLVTDSNNNTTVLINFSNQRTDGETVMVSSAFLSEGGFLTVRDSDGNILGSSEYIQPEVSATNVTIGLDPALNESQELTVFAHRDTDNNQNLTFVESDGETDTPYVANGTPVNETAFVEVGGISRVDSDDDELPDEQERELGTDPLDIDTDGDGLGDGYEVRVVNTDPKVRDTDGDGVNDYREVWVHDTDPLDPNDTPE